MKTNKTENSISANDDRGAGVRSSHGLQYTLYVLCTLPSAGSVGSSHGLQYALYVLCTLSSAGSVSSSHGLQYTLYILCTLSSAGSVSLSTLTDHRYMAGSALPFKLLADAWAQTSDAAQTCSCCQLYIYNFLRSDQSFR